MDLKSIAAFRAINRFGNILGLIPSNTTNFIFYN